MSKLLSYVSLVCLSTAIFAGLFWFFTPRNGVNGEAVAPIPSFLTINNNNQVRILDFWAPFIQKTYGSTDLNTLTAESVLVYDLTTKETIYEKNAQERLPMASLTKIMTAIVGLENQLDDDRYIVEELAIVGEDSMGLEPGEILTFEELLYGLMLPSGNDASEVIARNYPAGRTAFIQAMNDRAKSLGLTDTQFSNPSGLQSDGMQYTTAYDLLVMTRYVLETYPLFARIVAQAEYVLPATHTHKEFNLTNSTNLLTTYEGVKGVKTGFTPEAGLCLVTYLDYGGHKIIAVVLNSQDRRAEMRALLDHSLQSQGIEPPE
ncbi:MAG: D-alanyl-D-alanine carboxypeptidase family protein [Patescibacteria group bacterium]